MNKLLVIFLLSLSAYAYEFTSDFKNGFYWASLPVKIQVVDSNPSRKAMLEDLVQVAVDEWESASGVSIWNFNSGSGGHVIRWSTNFSQETGMSSFSTLAVTVRYSEGPYFSKTEIIINGNNSTNLDLDKLQTVIVHELGHTIGLDHSQFTDSVMYSQLVVDDYAGLSHDDVDGMSSLVAATQKRQADRYVSPLAYTIKENEAASCGIVAEVDNDQSGPPPGSSFLASFILGMLVFIAFSQLKFKAVKTISSSWKTY
jgi:hypothetical protein